LVGIVLHKKGGGNPNLSFALSLRCKPRNLQQEGQIVMTSLPDRQPGFTQISLYQFTDDAGVVELHLILTYWPPTCNPVPEGFLLEQHQYYLCIRY